ncbi:hypothetical protein NHH03_13145 [Stieleria sp. TO1_6]|uniref:hypothetical protein n=1 Tax=Stieleria tagensis TaxID=2956795 RepID=UPI00209A9574|nr:hypothetical protein [Stieleria tagensis]MCO8122687.1 hypothetical protein [Stieleria tagensis]
MPRKRRQSQKSSPPDAPPDAATTAVIPTAEANLSGEDESSLVSAQWTGLRKTILNDLRDQPAKMLFGACAKRGVVYRWGIAIEQAVACDDSFEWLTRLASGSPTTGKRFQGIEAGELVRDFETALASNPQDVHQAAVAVAWSAAMPALLHQLDENQWWSLLGSLQEYRDSLLQRDSTDPLALVGVAEIGLTLAHVLRALPSCRRLASSGKEALMQWCEQEDLSVSAALSQPLQSRLVLASLLRCRSLVKHLSAQSPPKQPSALLTAIDQIGIELATWVAALSRTGGGQAPSLVQDQSVRDDCGPHGLLLQAAQLDPESLLPAMKAALGQSRSKGRLAWQVSLPESMLHDEDAKLACLLPEWDVRRGRTVVTYNGPDTSLDLMAGKSILISGCCETHVAIDGQTRQPIADWVATCEYTDDDVHYLELEQALDGGYALQRQIMVLREDRCCYFADAVVGDPSQPVGTGTVNYQLRMPLGPGISGQIEPETTELFLGDGRSRALVMPLSASEWKATHTSTTLAIADDQHLLVRCQGQGQLYAPLWFDLSRKRFDKQRTWRQLTVGHQLQLVPANQASAYRIQIGREQWILYRSLADAAPRTFFGKHMIADFYVARFNAKKKSFEDLITVEDNAS